MWFVSVQISCRTQAMAPTEELYMPAVGNTKALGGIARISNYLVLLPRHKAHCRWCGTTRQPLVVMYFCPTPFDGLNGALKINVRCFAACSFLTLYLVSWKILFVCGVPCLKLSRLTLSPRLLSLLPVFLQVFPLPLLLAMIFLFPLD